MPGTPLHSKQTVVDGIHTAVSYVYANAALRIGASGFVADDLYKLAVQSDDGSLWMLIATTPVWSEIATGGSAIPDDTLVFGAAGVGLTTTARWMPFGYTPNTAPIAPIAFRSLRSGTLSNLRVRHNVVGVGGNISYTLRRNGVDSALTAAVAASALDGSDLTHSVVIAAGDLLDLHVTKLSGISTSPINISASVEFNA